MEQNWYDIEQIKDGISWLFGNPRMSRLRAEWMTASDEVILEFLEDSGAAHNKQGIANNLEYRNAGLSYTTLNRRLPKLNESQLIRAIPGQGKYYEITDKGRAFLAGDADLRDETEPEG